MIPTRPLRLICCGALLTLAGACTEQQERQHDMDVAEPDHQVDPTRAPLREPLRPGIQPPPEHRHPMAPGLDERLEAREHAGDPRSVEGPPHTQTDQPLPVDQPVPAAADDRPEGLDPREDPLTDPIGEPRSQR